MGGSLVVYCPADYLLMCEHLARAVFLIFSAHNESQTSCSEGKCCLRSGSSDSAVPGRILWSCCRSHQRCPPWEETQRGARASFPSLSWETPTTPAPRPGAATARCGALPPRAMMTTANGASVPIKVRPVCGHFKSWKNRDTLRHRVKLLLEVYLVYFPHFASKSKSLLMSSGC